ncbi:hypothetical protein N7454_004485 [Penicillium verhagenii]|nr:hypothetical protein N7454_004485 [Penicillium verhagenii]
MEYRLGLAFYPILTLLAWLLHTVYKGFVSPLRRIPGPRLSNFTRLPLKLATITGNQVYYIHELHQQYGPIVRISPSEVSVSYLPDVKEIHRIGSGFLKTEWYGTFTRGREGVFSMRDVKKHADRRRLFARPFSKSALRTSWEPIVKEKAQLMISQIQKDLTTAGVCDIFKWATFLATDVSTHLMFGESFEMIQRGEKNEYIRILESVTQGSGILAELPLLKYILPYIPLKTFREMFGNGDVLLRASSRLVTNSRGSSNSTRNIFSGLVHASEKEDAPFTEKDVAIEASNLIVAGSDTTAVTLTYLIWAILSRPKLHADLQAELADLRPNWEESDLETLPLLNATITETLRLYGAAPGSLPRSVPEGGVSFSGHYIPAGTTVSTQCWTVHRDPALFPDPEKFDPERWLPGRNQASEQARLAMSPFGSGARTCLGIHLSWMELRLVTTEFLRQCGNVKLAESVSRESMKPRHFFLIAPAAHKCEIVPVA